MLILVRFFCGRPAHASQLHAIPQARRARLLVRPRAIFVPGLPHVILSLVGEDTYFVPGLPHVLTRRSTRLYALGVTADVICTRLPEDGAGAGVTLAQRQTAVDLSVDLVAQICEETEGLLGAARASPIPSLCTRFTRAGIEWRRLTNMPV